MTGEQFVAALETEMRELFAQLGEQDTLEGEGERPASVSDLLRLALRSEMEASELAAYWMPTTPEIDAKAAFAEQCGDEMKHYQRIAERLRELGEAAVDYDPVTEGYSPLYHYLKGLRTTVERIAAGPFTCEAVATVRNRQFIAFCERQNDARTAALYREVIQPDEVHHQQLGAEVLAHHCTTPELQEAAREAVRSTLAISDELRTLAAKTSGVRNLPVS